MNTSNYLDLEQIFVNELIGDTTLFIFVGLILIWIAGVKTKMPYQVSIILSILWIGVMLSIASATAQALWVLVVMGVGGIFYYMLSRIMNR